MPLNLITDRWIPVIRKDGARATIAPHEIASGLFERPDWPRPDFNIACLEFLIGLVYLAAPPQDVEDWEERRVSDPERLRRALLPFADAFNMTGPKPLFMQDLDDLGADDPAGKDVKGVDVLFIDSAGENTVRHNKDLMVSRDRETSLDLATAAMAFYTLQVFAPVGGSGIRAGLRGGGPLTTLVDPGTGLWDLVWANVPYGVGGSLNNLPWTRPTRTSQPKSTTPTTIIAGGNAMSSEMFFSMPRRINLIIDKDRVVGVRQKQYGTNYERAVHPLTPYYLDKNNVLLPIHPREPRLGYENWLGHLLPPTSTGQRASCLDVWDKRQAKVTATVLMAGWNMSNATAIDYVEARPVLHNLSADAERHLRGMIEAATKVADATGKAAVAALSTRLTKAKVYKAARTQFFDATDAEMDRLYADLAAGRPLPNIGRAWHDEMRRAALQVFDAMTATALADPKVERQKAIVGARVKLFDLFGTRVKAAKDLRAKLDMSNQEAHDAVDA